MLRWMRSGWRLAVWMVPLCAMAQQSTRYTVEFPNALHHEAEITATFSGITEPELHVVMSRSSPGRYALAEFAKNIYNVRAEDAAGHPIRVGHDDPYSWWVAAPAGGKGTVVFRYTLFGNHTDGTYAAIDETHAHLNMPATFLWARGFTKSTYTFAFHVPPGSKWKAATQLFPNADGTFSAPNLEQMMDSPVELSDHTEVNWKVEDAQFRLALHHQGTQAEAEEYARMCEAIVLEEEGVFGALPKYDGGTYTFLADFLPYASGDGMEHRDSTVMTAAADLKSSGRRLAGTASHEFFHSWNVRRMRPKSLEPFDFERANMSAELWFAEGFTNYYGLLALERAGLLPLDDFAAAMGQGVNAVMRAPGRTAHSAIEMSELAPFVDAAKAVDETNFGNTFISYYTYGQALAFGIDMAIREQFPGKSLDDWMREVWKEHPDIERPYNLGDLSAALARVTGDNKFASRVFEQHIAGKSAMDYEALVVRAGMVLRKARSGQAWLGLSSGMRGGGGVTLAASSGGLEIKGETLRETPLYEAGLNDGDVILKWDGKTTGSGGDLKDGMALLQGRHPGEVVTAVAKTRAGEKTLAVKVAEDPRLELVTFEKAGKPITPEIAAFRKLWLSSKAMHRLPKVSAE